MKFLSLDLEKTLVINCDETWVSFSDYKHSKWCLPYSTNTMVKKQVQPRISMIAALDSHGRVRICLLQANSNSETFMAYMHHLIA